MRHRTGGVGLQDRAEGAVALLPPEGMEHRHGVLEPGPRLRGAGDGEDDPAELSDAVVVGVGLLRGDSRGGKQGSGDGENGPHAGKARRLIHRATRHHLSSPPAPDTRRETPAADAPAWVHR